MSRCVEEDIAAIADMKKKEEMEEEQFQVGQLFMQPVHSSVKCTCTCVHIYMYMCMYTVYGTKYLRCKNFHAFRGLHSNLENRAHKISSCRILWLQEPLVSKNFHET